DDIGHLVAFVMQMQRALRPDRNRFLEHHDAVAGRAAQQFHHYRPTRCEALRPALSGLYNDPLRNHRKSLLPSVRSEPRSTVIAIAQVGFRSTVRGSSTSISIFSPLKGVAAICVAPSEEL